MRVVVQRVSGASVLVDGKVIGQIRQGIMALVGFAESDGTKEFKYMLDKLIHLRIFEDDQGKLNRSVEDIGGGILIVPNFTLYGDCRQGRRPSFSASSKAEHARQQFAEFVRLFKEAYSQVETGEFQADMQVNLVNDGPVTLIIDADFD